MKLLGFKDPHDAVGKLINKKPIVGVVKDFHSRSLHAAIDPMIIVCYPGNMTSIGVRLKSDGLNNIQPTLEKMEAAWKKVYGDEKFEYKFVDEVVRSYYETELRTGRLAKAATGIAILISCLGLFALSSFTVIQRTKEIGIRKALGATVRSIVVLLSKDFILLVMIAFVVSAPVAYYVADRWLQDFAYRINVGAWVFVVAGLSSVVTALITISFRTMGAASADPVKALRWE
jgi:ABC-type antimicrobial peptide transport system permease subunit